MLFMNLYPHSYNLSYLCLEFQKYSKIRRWSYLQGVSVFEAVCHQLSFGQLIQPRQLPAAVTARVKSREALVAALQLDERTALCGMCTSQQSAVGASTQNTLFPVHGTKSALTQKRSTNARRLRLARHTEISAPRHRRESVLLPDS